MSQEKKNPAKWMQDYYQSTRPQDTNVYIMEVSPYVVYVGMTSKLITKRFKQHRRGRRSAVCLKPYRKDKDEWHIRWDLIGTLCRNPYPNPKMGREMEVQTYIMLHKMGFEVLGGT